MKELMARTELFWGTGIIFIVTFGVNIFVYSGVIDNPTFYIFIVPAIVNLYFILNKKRSRKLKVFNRGVLAIMLISFIIGVPKHTYSDIKSKIVKERFKGEKIEVQELGIKERKVKSMKRPSFFVEDFYRIAFKLEDGEVLNFYINPETAEWVEK